MNMYVAAPMIYLSFSFIQYFFLSIFLRKCKCLFYKSPSFYFIPLATGNCRDDFCKVICSPTTTWWQRNISSRIPKNSEANASEFLEFLEEMFSRYYIDSDTDVMRTILYTSSVNNNSVKILTYCISSFILSIVSFL